MLYLPLLLVGIFLSSVQCGYYFVTVPNVIRFDHDETVVVSVFDLNNAAVKVWLQHGEKKFSTQNVVVKNEATPVSTSVKVTENDLFDTVVEEKPRRISVCSEYSGQPQCREVVLSYQTGFLIVQTDKPIYTPLQRVKVRTLALDESLKKVNGWQVAMDVVSPSNMTIARKRIINSRSGFYENEFQLPPFPETGLWTARAFYSGQFETESRALFEVREYVLPTFGVSIDVDVPYILQDTVKIIITVRAKYVYGKPVDGNVRLTLNLKDENGISEYILDVSRRQLEADYGSTEGSVRQFEVMVVEILDSPLLQDRDFPAGSRLEIIATVLESATGTKEATSHDTTFFTVDPYKFKFTRSKLNFRPGWEYYLKIDMMHINGQPVTQEDLKVNVFKNGQFEESKRVTTDSQGRAIAIFTTTTETVNLAFTVSTNDERQESEKFEVQRYAGKNQIQAEQLIKDRNMILQASTNIIGSGYTGLLFMIVTRGKVVFTKFKEGANSATEVVTEEIQQLISPSARLLVFYVDKNTNELVADSVRFDVEQKCRHKGLKLETEKTQVTPGSNDQLTITGDPGMFVGLNVIDKALLLLNNKNVLRKNKMFEALESHDLGCGQGSGKNSADVLKKTGLTILTNAVVANDDLQRSSDDCSEMKRRKRDTGDCLYGADVMCCEKGFDIAEEIYYESEESGRTDRLDPYTKCFAKAKELIVLKKAPARCVLAYFQSCKTNLESLLYDDTDIISKSLDDESEYASDLAKLAEEGVRIITRTDFRESWLFEVEELIGGKMTILLSYPDSITEWMIQAIGITADKGMCIAEPVDVTAFRNFFIQLDLPYKATRLEKIDVKATIFSYGLPQDDSKTANIYLEAVENICYSTESGSPTHRIQIELPPNSAKAVRFPMIPVKSGLFAIKVTAIVIESGIPEVDAIEKKLYVVNEGIEEELSIQVCLDPNQQMEDCENDARVKSDVADNNNQEAGRIYTVDLMLPGKSIAGTGNAVGYMQSNIMDNVVKTLLEGVDSLFRKPTGCGEQTIIRVAPTVYAYAYVKETKQVTQDIEVKGNQLIRDGITREITHFRHPDGSYAAWQNRQSSTWLTAFVAKVFCQAKKVVDDAVDEQKDIRITIEWLKNHVTADGQFVDQMPVIHREMIGQINERDPSLTAFVLITLLECNIKTEGLDETIKKSVSFLEDLDRNMLKSNPYILAISTYALAMAKSAKKWEFKDLLHDIQQKRGKDIYWGNFNSKPANADTVETTAYALLAMMEFNDWKTSAHIVRWLTSQRDARGSFRTTQDTVVGLQSLSTYSIKTYSADVDLKVTLLAQEWEPVQFDVTRENSVVQQIARKLPVEHLDNELTVKVTGSGTGRLMIDLRYNRPASAQEKCAFDVTDVEIDEIQDLPIDKNLAKELNCDVCGRCEEDQKAEDYDWLNPPEADPKIESNFGRRKRQAGGRNIRATTTKICVRFSVSSSTEKKHGMSIVNFGLETGVEVVKEDLDKLITDNQNIASYEMPSSGKGFVVFYLQEVTTEETKFIFRLNDGFEGDVQSRQPASLTVYDYYNPDQSCTHFYGTGPNGGESISYECDKEEKECQCLQNLCSQPVNAELRRLKRPALTLFRYTCNSEKANYAVIVRIESITYDNDIEQKTARGLVVKSIHQGIEQLDVNDEMAFIWSLHCDHPDLEEEEEYYIIGRDGNKFKTSDGEDEYKYPLMGSAVVIKKPSRNQARMFSIFKKYEQIMAARGCQQ